MSKERITGFDMGIMWEVVNAMLYGTKLHTNQRVFFNVLQFGFVLM
jgi:hypothetical protein